MQPVLFHLTLPGRVFDLHAFGVLVALGLALGTVMAIREARLRRVDPQLVRDLCLWGLAACLLGGRLADVLTNGRAAWDDCLDGAAAGGVMGALEACTRPLRPWEGGLVFYGGVVAGLLTVWLFTRRHGMDLPSTLDLVTPSVPAGHVLGRIGCLLAGCCWGKPTPPGSSWGISFPQASVAFHELAQSGALGPGATATPPLHPTQIYEAAGEALLLVLVLVRRNRTRFAGELALTWLMGYSALRLVIELYRGDPSRAWIVELHTPWLERVLGLPAGSGALLSTSQGIALGTLLVSLVLLVRWRRRARTQPANRGSGSPATPVVAPR